MELDEDGNMMLQPDTQTALKFLYENWALLLSATVWLEIRLGMRRPRSEKNGTTNVDSALKKLKTGNYPLETEAGAGSPEIKEEYFADDSDSTRFSTLCEEGSTALKKIVKARALFCFIFDEEFSILAEMLKLRAGKDVS